LARYIRALHLALINETSTMECESLFLIVLSRTIMKYADLNLSYLTPGKEHRAVKSACRYILERAAERITLDDIAKCVNLSRYYFLRVFHKEIGILPHAYLESVRISKAKRLLKKGNTINQVAYEAGFSDQSHFTNCFKRLIGITPGQYVRDIRI
jgi:AraC-like DNA-binding protein